MAFGTGGGKLSIEVNGKSVGTIGSKPLATAFEALYTDRNAVCKLASAEDGGDEEIATGSSLVTPRNGAIVGAGLGWGIGKLLSN